MEGVLWEKKFVLVVSCNLGEKLIDVREIFSGNNFRHGVAGGINF